MTSRSRRRPSAFRLLATMSTRDMLRNKLTGFSPLFLYGWMFVVYLALSIIATGNGPSPVVHVAAADEARAATIVEELRHRGLDAEAGAAHDDGDPGHAPGPDAGRDPGHDAGAPPPARAPGPREILVSVSGDGVLVTPGERERANWGAAWRGLRAAGFGGDAISVIDTDGDVKVDPFRYASGSILMVGVASVALIGTAVPIVAMRERGLLRMMGTTPLRRPTFLLAQLPWRAALIAVGTAVGALILGSRGYLEAGSIAGLVTTLSLVSAMAFAFGLLFAGRSRNAAANQQNMVFLTMGLMFASGGLLPPGVLPGALEAALCALPSTWAADALNAGLIGADPRIPVPIMWALMAVTTAAVAALAVRRFEWDRRERPRPGRDPAPRNAESDPTSETATTTPIPSATTTKVTP